MTASVMAVAIFCEDARHEANGAVTLIGLMPDNVFLPQIPFALPKLCIYARVNAPAKGAVSPFKIFIRAPDQTPIFVHSFEKELIKSSQKTSRDQKNPIITLIAELTFAGFVIPTPGRVTVNIDVGGQETMIGSLNLQVGSRPTP